MSIINKFITMKSPSAPEQVLLNLLNEALDIFSPEKLMKREIKKVGDTLHIQEKKFNLSKGKLYVLGWGKAALSMARAIESVLGPELIENGIIITNTQGKLLKIKVMQGAHPFPTKKGVASSKELVSLAEKCEADDTVICLVSGGGSAMLSVPVDGITVDDKISATKALMFHGVQSEQINILRKHISQVKGGKLAAIIHPARIINLILSDNITNKADAIASGATVPDSTTFQDCLELIKGNNLQDKIPKAIMSYLKTNDGNDKNETLKEDSMVFEKTTTIILGDNKGFLEQLKSLAIQQGFNHVSIYPETLHGDIMNGTATVHNFITKELKRAGDNSNALILAGGELEVKTKNEGKGGRCQHLSALMIPLIAGDERDNNKQSVFTAAATDGRDYVEGITGAMITGNTQKELVKKRIDYEECIENTDTFSLHKTLGTHLITSKETRNNLLDVYAFARYGDSASMQIRKHK